jgi:hypothetical protein
LVFARHKTLGTNVFTPGAFENPAMACNLPRFSFDGANGSGSCQ